MSSESRRFSSGSLYFCVFVKRHVLHLRNDFTFLPFEKFFSVFLFFFVFLELISTKTKNKDVTAASVYRSTHYRSVQ